MLALKIAALDAQNAGHNKIVKLVLVSTTPKFCQQDEWKFGILKETLLDLKNRIAANYESGMNYFYDFIGSEFSRQENLNSWDQKRALSVINLLEKEDLRPILSQIQIPTLIISSEEDQICLPGASRYLAKNISGAKYVIFPSSHAPFLTSPERFSSLIADFAGESSINVR
jgi:pimeloyl-[acyl-carrier protein] methyl ester esterase